MIKSKTPKKSLLFVLLFLNFAIIVGLGCSQTDIPEGSSDTTIGGDPNLTTTTTLPTGVTTIPVATMNELPGRYGLKLPGSILSTTTEYGMISSRSTRSNDSLHKDGSIIFDKTRNKTRSRSRAGEEQSFGYMMLQSLAGWVYDNNKDIARNFVVLDELIAQESLTTSTEYHNTIDFVVTTETIDKIKFFADNYAPEDDFWLMNHYDENSVITEDYEMTIPYFLYLDSTQFATATLDPTINTEGYDKLILMNYYMYFMEWGVESDPFFIYVLWSSDNNVRVIYDWKSETEPFRMEMYYNLSKNIAGMIMIYESYPWEYDEGTDTYFENIGGEKEKSIYSIIIQGDDMTKNAIMAKSISKTVSSEKSDEFILEGYIDDNGGYCEYLFSSENLKDSTSKSILEKASIDKYRDQFDGLGNMTGWQVYNDSPEDLYFETDTLGWSDFSETLTWNDTNYDYNYEIKVNDFIADVVEIKAEEPVKENLKADQEQITLTLPSNVTFDETNDEVKKTFVITKYGEPPLPDGSNIVGVQHVTKEEYESRKEKPVSMLLKGVEPGDISSKNDLKIYEVEYNKVELGTTNPTTIVNVGVKAACTIVKAASGLFESGAGALLSKVETVNPILVKVPNVTDLNTNWGANEKKLMVITNDGLAPKSDGSNVVGMSRITKDAANNPKGVAIPLDKNKAAGTNEFGTFVYDAGGESATSGNPQFGGADGAPANTDTVVADANGDGDFDAEEKATGEDADEGEEEEEEEDETIPAPQNLTASTNNPDCIALKWEWNEDGAYEDEIDGFNIYYDAGGLLFKFLDKVDAGTKEYKDTKVEAGASRTYSVRIYQKPSAIDIAKGLAEDGIGGAVDSTMVISDDSTPATGTRQGAKPITPKDVAATENTTDAIIISWTVTSDTTIDSYNVYRWDPSTDIYEKIDTIADVDGQQETYRDVNVVVGKKYKYKIKSVSASTNNTESEDSIEYEGMVNKLTTSTITEITTTNGDSIDMTWDVVPGADFYLLHRRQKDDASPKAFQQIGGKITTNSYKDTSAKAYKTTEPYIYEYCVSACKEKPANQSDKSGVKEGKRVDTDRPAPIIKGYNMVKDSSFKIIIDYQADATPDKLELYHSKDNGQTWEWYNPGTGISPDLKKLKNTGAELGKFNENMYQYKLIAEWFLPTNVKKDSNILTVEKQTPFQPPTYIGVPVPPSTSSNGYFKINFTLPYEPGKAPGTSGTLYINLEMWDSKYSKWVNKSGNLTTTSDIQLPFDRVSNSYLTATYRIKIPYKDNYKDAPKYSAEFVVQGFQK